MDWLKNKIALDDSTRTPPMGVGAAHNAKLSVGKPSRYHNSVGATAFLVLLLALLLKNPDDEDVDVDPAVVVVSTGELRPSTTSETECPSDPSLEVELGILSISSANAG